MYRLRSAPFRPLLSALCLVFATSWTGCSSPQPIGGSDLGHEAASVPPWVGSKLSWSKLEQIQAWQMSSRGQTSPYWRVEGELQLAEGRLVFAENAVAGAAMDQTIRERLLASRRSFERVLADRDANTGQQSRARTGSKRCRELLSTPAGSRSGVASGSVVTRGKWGARPARPSNMDSSSGTWRRITVHHSAMSDPIPLSGSEADSSVAVRRIQRAHMQTSGYGDIGYHFLIDPWGRVFQGRELTYQGAHAGGSNNVGNIGICLIGNFDRERPTTSALDTLEQLVDGLRNRYGIPAGNLVAHSDLKSTNCPGRNLRPWVERYRGAIARR